MSKHEYNQYSITEELYSQLKDDIVGIEVIDTVWSRENKTYMWNWLVRNLK